jgi:hypothetical protein
MHQQCAFAAHSSSFFCADYAHDTLPHTVQKRHMDTEWFKAQKKKRGGGDLAIASIIRRDRSVVNRIVNGEMPFDPQLADGFAEAFGVTRDEILYRAGITTSLPSQSVAAGPTLMLPVSLPSGSDLTSMFAGMLETADRPDLVAELAPRLAQLLPGGLVRATAPHKAQDRADEETLPGEGAQPRATGRRGRPSQPHSG